MSAVIDTGRPWLAQMRTEWRSNARLRLGLLVVAAVLWLWLVLLLQDQARAWQADAEATRAEIERLRPLQSATQWPQRAEEARKHLEAARAMMWTAASQGLAEADLQDSLRSWAEKAGLPVRELTVSASSESGVPGVTVLRARLVVDMNRIGLMGLLSELGRSPRLMLVDTLRLRPQQQPARAELELKVLFRPEERKP